MIMTGMFPRGQYKEDQNSNVGMNVYSLWIGYKGIKRFNGNS